MNVSRITLAAFLRARSDVPRRARLSASRGWRSEMSGLWTLIGTSLAGAQRAEEIALRLRSGATAPVTLVDRLFFDLFPLPRAVHVRGEAGIYQDHDQARYR